MKTYNAQISFFALVNRPFRAFMEFDGSLFTIGELMMQSRAKQNKTTIIYIDSILLLHRMNLETLK